MDVFILTTKESPQRNYKLRVLAVSYQNKSINIGQEPVIDLFGRTQEGKSVTVLYQGFRPYFHLVDLTQDALGIINDHSDITETEYISLWHEGFDRPGLKIYIRLPTSIPKIRRELQDAGATVLAADVPYHLRFYYDFDLGSCVEVEGVEVPRSQPWTNYTTELVVDATSIKRIEPFKVPLTILSFDIEKSIKTDELLCVCAVLRMDDGKQVPLKIAKSPRTTLQEFTNFIKLTDPDIITGYNIDGYDLPELEKLARKLRVKFDFSRNGTGVWSPAKRKWTCAGRVIADAWWNVKREKKPMQETLGAVSKEFLGKTKHDVDPKRIDEEWAKDRDKVVEYCLEDAFLALELLEHVKALDKYQDLSTVTRLPLDDALNGSTSGYIDSLMIRMADHNGVGVPLTKKDKKTRKIQGGYVHPIIAGIHKWVCGLDFKAMYPSVIIANNICFTTLSEEGTIESPIGAKFLDPSIKVGLLPEMLKGLWKDRDAAKNGIHRVENQDERDYYDGLQAAIKIIMNSVYGVFASSFYRFTDPQIGESVTTWAQQNIKRVISDMEKNDRQVIYSDTDSVFVASPEESINGCIIMGKTFEQMYSKSEAKLEFEKIINPLFSHGAKKRYIGKVIWPEEDTLIVGYETKRTDVFPYLKKVQKKAFDLILDEDINGMLQHCKRAVTKVLEEIVPIPELVISQTVKEEESYVNPDKVLGVQAARKLLLKGRTFVPGMKVGYLVTFNAKRPILVEPYIKGEPITPDWNYYARRVAKALSRITDVFGLDEKTLRAGVRQKTLFDLEPGFGRAK